MDQIKIGRFIAEMRKEKGYTQEQLGEILGVTNKTVSRWETGSYMPDVETLFLLSKEFDVSINEIVAGERLDTEDFKKTADENLAAALNDSAFSLKEKTDFFKKKWKREHIFTFALSFIAWATLIIALKLQNAETYLIGTVGGLVATLFYIVLYNRMMIYTEKHVYMQIPRNEMKNEDNGR